MRNNINSFLNKTLSFIRGDETKSSFSKIKASLFAILIGLVIGIIPIMLSNGDALKTYVALFTKPFNHFKFNSTIIYVAIFILMGAGIGVSFKTGLFNIGAAGQMLLAGGVTTMMGIELDLPKGVAIPILIVISIAVGALTSAFAGYLKAQFNVHEVVSTILLNWIIFFVVKYIFLMDLFKGSFSDASKPVHDSMGFNRNSKTDVYIILAIAIVSVAILGFVLKYTTFGFKLRMNGLNGDAAQYAGVNKKMTTVSAMAISGGFIGLAGFIYYGTISKGMPALDKDLPTIAFEAITVTLLAFSAPTGAIIAGAFYGIMYNGIESAGIQGNIPKEVIDLVVGIIVFASALAPILANTRIYYHVTSKTFKMLNSRFRLEKKNSNKQLKEIKAKFSKEISDARKFIKSSKEDIRAIHNKWDSEISLVREQFNNKKIDIVARDQKTKEINKKYKKLISENNYDQLSHIKTERHAELTSIKRKLSAEVEIAVSKYKDRKKTTKNKKELRKQWLGGKIW